jgi:hypothetical protein
MLRSLPVRFATRPRTFCSGLLVSELPSQAKKWLLYQQLLSQPGRGAG